MIVINDDQFSDRIAQASGCAFNFDVDQSIARVGKLRELLGGVVYSDFNGYSIQMHTVGFTPRWVNPDILWMAFDYPFNQLKVNTIFAQVPAHNERSLKFCSGLGFKEVVRIAGAFENEDLVLLRMYKDECRFLRPHRLRSQVMSGDESYG